MTHDHYKIACLDTNPYFLKGLAEVLPLISSDLKLIPCNSSDISDENEFLAVIDPSKNKKTDTPSLSTSSFPLRLGSILDEIETLLLQDQYDPFINYLSYKLDWDEFTLYHHGKAISLTDRERTIIAELLLAKDKGCNRDYLLSRVWRYRSDLDTHTLETHIYRLRQKIESEPEKPEYLETIPNGYRLG